MINCISIRRPSHGRKAARHAAAKDRYAWPRITLMDGRMGCLGERTGKSQTCTSEQAKKGEKRETNTNPSKK